jgi:hypothetical protein
MTTQFVLEMDDLAPVIHIGCILAQVILICYYNYRSKLAVMQAQQKETEK